MPWTWDLTPRIVSGTHEAKHDRGQTPKGSKKAEAQVNGLRADRVALITQRIRMKRAGAKVQVREEDVRMALAGADTVHTRCMALSLRELDEREFQTWIKHGLITRKELQTCQALDPRKR